MSEVNTFVPTCSRLLSFAFINTTPHKLGKRQLASSYKL